MYYKALTNYFLYLFLIKEAGNGSLSGRDPSRTIPENTQEEETTITLNQKKLLVKLVKCQDKNLKLSEEKSRCLEKLNVANEKVAALAIKLAESKDQQIVESENYIITLLHFTKFSNELNLICVFVK